jgi:hypothetical protein
MQLECHKGSIASPAALFRRSAHQNEHSLKLGLAAGFISAGLRGETPGGLLNGDGQTPRQALSILKSYLRFYPDRKWVNPEGTIVQGVWNLLINRGCEYTAEFRGLERRIGGARKALVDDRIGRYCCSEQPRRD